MMMKNINNNPFFAWGTVVFLTSVLAFYLLPIATKEKRPTDVYELVSHRCNILETEFRSSTQVLRSIENRIKDLEKELATRNSLDARLSIIESERALDSNIRWKLYDMQWLIDKYSELNNLKTMRVTNGHIVNVDQ